MPRKLLTLALLLATSASFAQPSPPRYSEVRFYVPDGLALHELGVDIDHVRTEKHAGRRALVTVMSESEIGALAARGVDHDVLVADLAAEIEARAPMNAGEQAAALAARGGGGFGFGSMGGYYTFDEVVAKLDEMAAAYPELVSEKVSLGKSWEGNDVWMVKISDNPNVDEDEPEALYDALHHAREPQSMATVLYYMFHLLENYGTDEEVTYLVDNRELYFIPVLNPDGYLYNQQTNPNGGGFWRKNRRDNGGNVFGVDLNRNYGFSWGYDNLGSSPNASSDTYRGPSAFSEPETQAIRDFLLGREVKAALNYHAYGDLWIYPWGYEPSFYTPDSALFVDSAREMTRINNYSYGTGDQTVGYVVNGDSDDWMYGEQKTKGKIFSYTPEVGPSFWPPQSQILPIAEENIEANNTLAWFVGGYPLVSSFAITDRGPEANGALDPGDTAEVTLSLMNLGLEDLESVQVRIVSTDPGLPVASESVSEPIALASQATTEITLSFTVGTEAPLGLQTGLAVEMDLGDVTLVRALGAVGIGTPIALFEDDASTADAWDLGDDWGLTPTNTSPPTAFTDSPDGSYADDATSAISLATPLDLSATLSPQVRFKARWDIERGYDFVQVRASTNRFAWTALEGRYTRPGSGNGVQVGGAPGYDGFQSEWVEEVLDLSAFEGEPEVYLEIRLQSDESLRRDGFYFDDFAIESYGDGGAVTAEDELRGAPTVLHSPFPNPFASQATVSYSLGEAGPRRLAVYDLLGRRVKTLADGNAPAGAHRETWDGRDADGQRLANGLYILELRAGSLLATKKLMLVR